MAEPIPAQTAALGQAAGRPTASMSKLGGTIGGAPVGAARANPSATARTTRWAWRRKNSVPPRPGKFGGAGANPVQISRFAMARTRACDRGNKNGRIDKWRVD